MNPAKPIPQPPPVSLAVVEWLEGIWPDRFPESFDPAALQLQAGRLEVIRLLRQHAERAVRSIPPTRTQSPF